MNKSKLLKKAQNSPSNLHFNEMRALVEAFGFELDHIEGDHHIFYLASSKGHLRLNLQPVNGRAKPYQVRDFLKKVKQYDLTLED